jgi:hypothetical protein
VGFAGKPAAPVDEPVVAPVPDEVVVVVAIVGVAAPVDAAVVEPVAPDVEPVAPEVWLAPLAPWKLCVGPVTPAEVWVDCVEPVLPGTPGVNPAVDCGVPVWFAAAVLDAIRLAVAACAASCAAKPVESGA